MNIQKKLEEPGKRKDAVYIYIRGPLREWLEEERKRRGGVESGVKLQPIITEKLQRQLEAERRKKKS